MIAPPKPPTSDEREALIKEARARQLRRRLLGAAGIAIAAALGLSAYALVASGDNQSATRSSAPGGVPQCKSAQLATSAEAGQGEGAGHAGASIQLVNTSGLACALPTGIPTVTFSLHGRTAPADERTMAPPYTGLGPRAGRVLAPGRKVMYVFNWSPPACHPPAGAVAKGTAIMSLRFRDGLRIAMPERTPEDVPIIPGCGKDLALPQTVLVTPLLQVPS
jgi:Protein of unknown function (DUF4232)